MVRRGSGWYQLPSGEVIHLTADKVPNDEALVVLDQVVEAAHRWMAICRLRNILMAVATGSSTYRTNCIMRRPRVPGAAR